MTITTLRLALALAGVVSAPAMAQAPAGHGGWNQSMNRADAVARADQMFGMLDLNHDGTVTTAEAQQATAQFAAANGGDAGRMQHRLDRLFGGAQSVTKAQVDAQALARFDRQDLNHDGVVTPEEREQGRANRDK